MTLIHQITDPHIPVSGDLTVRDNFLQLMDFSRQEKPDLLVITGDLPGEDGDREAYEWVLEQLPESIACLVIPGNHDDPDALFDVFQSDQNRDPDFFERIALDEIDLIFVNTASTWLPDNQMTALEDESIRPGSVLFIHHPTKQISTGFMDTNYPLGNREATDQVISKSAIEHVFCGHFHADYSIEGDYNLHITPSPAFDVDLDSVKPKIGPARIPLREIVIEGSAVSNRVVYLNE